MALFADAALGQSLAIVRTGNSEFLVEASAPPDTGYVVQASADLQDWVDIKDGVSGQLSYRFDSAGVITRRFFRLAPTPRPITLVIVGDSMVMDGSGWGQGIYGYLKPSVTAVNLAWAGISTRTFLASEQKDKMLVIRPDFVLAMFGSVDQLVDNWNGTTLQEYRDNLKTIVQTIRGFNGTPILITPSAARLYDDQGTVMPVYRDRSAVVREVAAETQSPLIDLNRLSSDLFNELGESESTYITWEDRSHFTPEGAEVIAGLVVQTFPKSLRPYLLPPQIRTQPQNEVVRVGSTARLEVVAAGPGLIYQWYFNGQALAGATSAVLTLPHVTASDQGRYAVLVSSPSGSVLSEVVSLSVVASIR